MRLIHFLKTILFMKKIAFVLLFVLGFVGVQNAWAQRTITGKVTDKKNVAVSGASVLIKGTTVGTTTDKNGNFSISVEATGTLQVSYGGESQDVALKATDKNVTVKFKSSLKDLEKQMNKAAGNDTKKKKKK
ncbi:MAG: hypothetical protein EAZ95_11915 [Bacteroidetes bacterium]|nr:MAG: hypothetical protein EAZ95_11915 [Bacteroidota bacterium]